MTQAATRDDAESPLAEMHTDVADAHLRQATRIDDAEEFQADTSTTMPASLAKQGQGTSVITPAVAVALRLVQFIELSFSKYFYWGLKPSSASIAIFIGY